MPDLELKEDKEFPSCRFLFQSLFYSLCSCPTKRWCCFSHSWLCTPLTLVSGLYRWQYMQIKMMGSCMILFLKGTKRAQQVMEAQPVFLFKPELLFYFSKGMSKSRGDVFSPTRTVQSHLANQVCLFRQGHRVVAENTQTCPWLFLEWKGADGLRQKRLGHG